MNVHDLSDAVDGREEPPANIAAMHRKRRGLLVEWGHIHALVNEAVRGVKGLLYMFCSVWISSVFVLVFKSFKCAVSSLI